MWKCLKCNTVNEGKFCHGCGEPKPLSDDNISQTSRETARTEAPSQNKFKNAVSPNYKTNNKLLVLCIVLVVALIITVIFAAIILIGGKNPNNDKSEKTRTEDIDERYDENSDNDEEDDSINEAEVEDDSDADREDEKETLKSAANESEGTYGMYENTYYDFHCAYPNNFNSIEPNGANVLKCFESEDGTAVMEIRACKNSEGIGVKEALEEYCNIHDGQVTYKVSGDEWYAVSIEYYNRGYYRKCFVKKDNIYCMDFEFDMEDVDIYSPYIEYIEDNFAHN